MGVMRPIGHEDRLSIVDHLDELRNRLIACLVVFTAAFAFCYWQNDKILEIVNEPLEQSQRAGTGNDPLEQTAEFDAALEQLLVKLRPGPAADRGRAHRPRR